MDVEALIEQLTLEEKVALTSGKILRSTQHFMFKRLTSSSRYRMVAYNFYRASFNTLYSSF